MACTGFTITQTNTGGIEVKQSKTLGNNLWSSISMMKKKMFIIMKDSMNQQRKNLNQPTENMNENYLYGI